MSELPPLAFIYAAKSTVDKKKSIPDQVEDAREMCLHPDPDQRVYSEKWGAAGEGVPWEIAVNLASGQAYWADENFTAYTGNRGPALADVIERAKAAGLQDNRRVYIVTQHTSRFARGDGAAPDAAKALVELWHEWARCNVRGRTAENDKAMSSSSDAAKQGELDYEESKRKSRSIRKGLRRRARDRGKIAGGSRPYAYRWVDGTLEVVPEEVPVVERIFDEYLSGRSQMEIARCLSRDGIKAATGGRWTQVSVRNVLMKPLYVGKVSHLGEVHPGDHAAVVSEELWQTAQNFRAAATVTRTVQNAKGNYRGAAKGSNNCGGRHPAGPHLFTKGLLRCGSCGDAMAPGAYRSGTEFYACAGRRKDKASCSQLPVKREVIDNAMLSELERRYLDLRATRDRYRDRRVAEAALATETIEQAQRELMRVEAEFARFKGDYRSGSITAAEWHELKAETEPELAAARAALARATQRAATVDSQDVTDELLDWLRAVRAAVLGGLDRAPDLNAHRKLLRGLFEQVLYWPTERWGQPLVVPGSSAGCNVGPHALAGQAVLVPVLRREAILGYLGDPLESNPIARRTPLEIPAGFVNAEA
jgi:Recombinase/Recombinase zinc beta ribbon domain